MKKVGVLGSGVVSQVLADGLLKHGYDVMRGSRDPSKLTPWQTPDTLFYDCAIHAAMTGTIHIVD
jgi:saccharopine dehydrogenase-like NADP-dependent oxidoreductase